MRKTVLILATAAMAATSAPALADKHRGHRHYRGDDHGRHYQTSRNGVRYWRGDDGRYYCKRDNGTTGLIVGAAAGALAGRAIDTQGDRATGTVLGAAAGALLGREIDRGPVRCR
jgi:outer membrane lipoprotein SlyB